MIFRHIAALLQYSLDHALIRPEDTIVIRNRLLDALSLTGWEECPPEPVEHATPDALLAPLVDYAVQSGLIADTAASRDLFDTRLMGLLTLWPHEIIRHFWSAYQISPRHATDWYYAYNQKLNYVRAGRMANDLKWTYQSDYGTLEITINRAKPEKDPRDIAAAQSAANSDYPRCPLCPENAGFAGDARRPARQNLCPIPIFLPNDPWQLQYSPYGYYNEHCILFSQAHVPMRLDESIFATLFDVLDLFPHYFFGSNAELPIVGGSILSHEHFQGGRHRFAMEAAPIETTFSLPGFPTVTAGIVRWPMSVIRCSSPDREALIRVCAMVLERFRRYDDPQVGLLSKSGNTPHNTITPIARIRATHYECDLVLRNNRTTPERPLGLFHPNPTLHHIKKENIGLIEVMGLAVLPARLAAALSRLEALLPAGEDPASDPLTAPHASWARDIQTRHPELTADTVDEILREEVGAVFEAVLHDAGIFKRTRQGTEAFTRFVQFLQAK